MAADHPTSHYCPPLCSFWDYMLPGPPSKNNGGAADISNTGLLAYAAGSSVTIVDVNSMQLIFTLPLPPHPSSVDTIAAATAPQFNIKWNKVQIDMHEQVWSIQEGRLKNSRYLNNTLEDNPSDGGVSRCRRD
ncbi:WD repeat-containing protein 11-like [Forsythia ovata]|uniref:WD repeat-containing protein 11-like n=1 Tax=Forsythia ovata TaxID=205694 RepID=A0ABD1PWL0_9LAMI